MDIKNKSDKKEPPKSYFKSHSSFCTEGSGQSPHLSVKKKYDIKEYNNITDEINAIINGGEVAEVKVEYKEGVPSLKVVRIVRKVTASAN